jgi:hypothetical protein
MFDGFESRGGAAADTPGRGISGDEVRILALEGLELAHQRVELGVGDLGIAQDVIAFFVMANLASQFVDSFGGIHVAS